jgi:hypothetical protein
MAHGVNASTMKPGFLLLFVLVTRAAAAGDYGLMVDSTLEKCQFARENSRNECPPEIVWADFRGHFLAGEPFGLEAVNMAVLSGRISFQDTQDLRPFSDLIVEICLAPQPFDFPALLRFLRSLPYTTLRSRLEEAHARAVEGPAKGRLREAIDALPNPRRLPR